MASALATGLLGREFQGFPAVFAVVPQFEGKIGQLVGARGDAGIDHAADPLEIIHLHPDGVGGAVADDAGGFGFLVCLAAGVRIHRVEGEPVGVDLFIRNAQSLDVLDDPLHDLVELFLGLYRLFGFSHRAQIDSGAVRGRRNLAAAGYDDGGDLRPGAALACSGRPDHQQNDERQHHRRNRLRRMSVFRPVFLRSQ